MGSLEESVRYASQCICSCTGVRVVKGSGYSGLGFRVLGWGLRVQLKLDLYP